MLRSSQKVGPCGAVPESAAKTYQRSETLRQQTGNLDLIVVTYNNILRSLLPAEKPLVEKKLEAIDAALQKAGEAALSQVAALSLSLVSSSLSSVLHVIISST